MAVGARALTFVLLAAASHCAFADVLPGEWDIVTTVSVSGQSDSIGPMHQTQCLDAAQAANPAGLFSPQAGAGAGCTLSDKRDDGSSLSFRLSCIGPFAADGSGAVSYGPDHMDGELRLRGSIAGQQFETRSHVAAQRIGPCQ